MSTPNYSWWYCPACWDTIYQSSVPFPMLRLTHTGPAPTSAHAPVCNNYASRPAGKAVVFGYHKMVQTKGSWRQVVEAAYCMGGADAARAIITSLITKAPA
jgi:hypothetical protein